MRGKLVKIQQDRDMFKQTVLFLFQVEVTPDAMLISGAPWKEIQGAVDGMLQDCDISFLGPAFDVTKLPDGDLMELQQACAQELARRMVDDETAECQA